MNEIIYATKTHYGFMPIATWKEDLQAYVIDGVEFLQDDITIGSNNIPRISPAKVAPKGYTDYMGDGKAYCYGGVYDGMAVTLLNRSETWATYEMMSR